jgi:hypothetical protein
VRIGSVLIAPFYLSNPRQLLSLGVAYDISRSKYRVPKSLRPEGEEV